MTPDYFVNRLYPLQDDVLHVITTANVGLYLTGGTAERLFNVTLADWQAVRWATPPDPEQYMRELKALAESLILIE